MGEGPARSAGLSSFYNNYIIKYMYYVYVLKSKKDDELYIGSTNDLRLRVVLHNEGKVKSTKSRIPFELRYYESYFNEDDARKREMSLKKDGRAKVTLINRILKSLR